MDGSIETPLFMAEGGEKMEKIMMEKKRRKSGIFLRIHFRFFSI